MDLEMASSSPMIAPGALATLVERAAANDVDAAATIIHGIAHGDSQVMRAVSRPGDPSAEQVRGAVVQYLARGTWQGLTLPLPYGYHAGNASHRLREVIIQATYKETVPVWQTSLLAALRSNDSGKRQVAALLLGHCGRAEIISALVTALGDHDESVRWAAASALVHANTTGIEWLLRQLGSQALVPEMRRVAAYVLRHTTHMELRDILAPVALGLDASDYRIETPLAAEHALRELEKRQAAE